MPVLIQHTNDNVRQVAESDRVRVPSREQTATTFLHQFSYVDSLTSRALIRTDSDKEGGRNTQTEVITRAWHEMPQKLRQMFTQ